MTASDELVEACDRYLSGRRVTLWGFLRTIHEPADRRVAAVWLAEQVAGVLVEKASGVAWADVGLAGGKPR